MASDDAQPGRAAVSAFPDVMGDIAVRRRRAEISARLFGTLEGATRIGRYRLGKRLGSGAIGVVHLAHDDLLGRDVALKLLRTDADAEARRAVREAQALARLSHPNVVSVFATGLHAEHAFIAMELVVGSTLRAWQRDRAWREIVTAYVQAGRGLAAAHAAGIVHRDFKPDNAMIGPDGRVRVLDFGLARGLAAHVERDDTIGSLSSDELVRSATGVGALVGTPAYMAPEQLSGTGADARSDQFAFCVALFEALWGERPFAGTTPASLLESELAETVRARPARSPVPGRIHDVLLRGLRADPELRWPSMSACLDALQRAARPWSPRLALATACVVVTAIAAVLVLEGDAPQDCSGGRARLVGVWDDARRAGLEARFGADESFPSVRGRLDDYADEWVEVWTQTCREAEGEALAVRSRCLDRRRDVLGATVDGLSTATPLGARAPALLGALDPIAPCLDATADAKATQLPDDPVDAAAVEAVERRMIGAHRKMIAGDLESSLRDYEESLTAARGLDWPPLLAHALYWTGAANDELELYDRARELFEEGHAVALETRRDELAALSATGMITILGYHRAQHDEAARWGRLAEAAIDRLGRPNRIEADLHNNLGLVAMDRGDHAGAREHYERSIEIYEAVGAKSALSVPFINLAEIAYLSGDYEEAERMLGRAIELEAGPGREDHPELISLLINRGIVRMDHARYDDAEADLKRALAIVERARGTASPSYAAALSNLGKLQAARRDWSGALDYFRRAVDTFARGVGRNTEQAAFAQAGAGASLVHLARVDEGDALMVQSMVEVESLLGPEHEEVAELAHDLGATRIFADRPAEALAPLRRAAAIFARSDGPNALRTARTRHELGRALLELGRIDEAIEELEWSFGVLQSYTLPPSDVGEIRFALARALTARARRLPPAMRAREAERIATLTRLAADAYREAGPQWNEELAKVEALDARR
jgi:tetratricopeptide (TPR) repeat protein